MATIWVDYKAVKEAVSMEVILAHYGITNLKKSGQDLRGPCPIHHGDNARSFSVSLSKNAFHCFSKDCKARGNVLDFVAAKEGCSVREAALKLAEWFGVISEPPEGKQKEVRAGGKEPVTDAPVDWLLKLVLQSVIEELEGEIALLTEQLEIKQQRLAELQKVVGL